MSHTVWVIDDDRSIRWVLEKALNQAGYETRTFTSAEGVIERLASETPHAILSDIRMPGEDGLALLQRIHDARPDIPVIIMTAHSDLDSAVSAYQGGAFDYLPKPFDIDDALALVQRAVEFNRASPAHAPGLPSTPDIIGEAPAMQEVFRVIGRLSHSHITVLINGESGTGKELVAKALHRHSPRSNAPFIALNMAAIPRDLIESELFGHEKGAFSGAVQQRQGRFEQADGGTLFLDEIGDMPAETQTRLLRVLADGVFYRVGGHQPVKVDVRIIAATHQNLDKAVQEHRFREDLFHRLNVIRLHLPRLSERREDIPALAQHFLNQAAAELHTTPKQLTPEVAAHLSRLPWPGNVRQLENACRWLTVMAAGHDLHLADLPPELREIAISPREVPNSWQEALRQWAESAIARGESNLTGQLTPEFERLLIDVALRHTHGKRQDAARLLGWGRNTLTRKLKEQGLSDDEDD